jgi:hypothetical protein
VVIFEQEVSEIHDEIVPFTHSYEHLKTIQKIKYNKTARINMIVKASILSNSSDPFIISKISAGYPVISLLPLHPLLQVVYCIASLPRPHVPIHRTMVFRQCAVLALSYLIHNISYVIL